MDIRLEGSLVFSAPDAKQKIMKAAKEKYVVLDLSEIEYMDSTGVDLIISLYKKLKEKGGTLKLKNVRENLIQIFNLFELQSLMEIQPIEERKKCLI